MPSIVTYIAIVERIPGKEFCAQFPDFPELRASDATIEGVGVRSAQALRAHIAQLIQADEGVPRPTSADAVKGDGRYRHGFLLPIDIRVAESRLYTRSRPRAEENYSA